MFNLFDFPSDLFSMSRLREVRVAGNACHLRAATAKTGACVRACVLGFKDHGWNSWREIHGWTRMSLRRRHGIESCDSIFSVFFSTVASHCYLNRLPVMFYDRLRGVEKGCNDAR